MLINLSSTPHNSWSLHTKNLAIKLFGEVEDYPKPNIENLNNNEITQLLKDWVCNELRFYAQVNYKQWGVAFLLDKTCEFSSIMAEELSKHNIKCVYMTENDDVLFSNFPHFDEK